MGYNMTRAIPMGIIGFVLGAALVVLLRGLQQMDEVWNPQLGLTMGGLFATIFFLWGIGGLSSKMAAHEVHEPEEDEFGNELPVEEHHHDEPTGLGILQEQVWTIAFWVVVVTLIAYAVAALPTGLGYTLSADPAANTNNIGFFTLELPFLPEPLVVSQLVLFVFVVAFTLGSLFFAAWLISKALVGLNSGIKTVKVEGNRPLTALPEAANAGLLTSGENGEAVAVVTAQPMSQRSFVMAGIFTAVLGLIFSATLMWRIFPEPTNLVGGLVLAAILAYVIFFTTWRKAGIALTTGLILLWLFYEALIGWIIKDSPNREILSISNAIILPILIFYTKQVLLTVGRVARWTGNVLRGLPGFLGQK